MLADKGQEGNRFRSFNLDYTNLTFPAPHGNKDDSPWAEDLLAFFINYAQISQNYSEQAGQALMDFKGQPMSMY